MELEPCLPKTPILFLGTPGRLSSAPLKALLQRFRVVGVCGAPQPKSSYRTRPLSNDLKKIAHYHGISYRDWSELNPESWKHWQSILSASYLLCVNFNARIPAWLLQSFPHKALGLHSSLLPELKGADPWFWSYYHQLRQSGFTLYQLNEQFDSGPILAQSTFEIPFGATASELWDEVLPLGQQLLVGSLEQLNQLSPKTELAQANHRPAPRIDPSHSYVDWQQWELPRIFHFLRGVFLWYRTLPSNYRQWGFPIGYQALGQETYWQERPNAFTQQKRTPKGILYYRYQS